MNIIQEEEEEKLHLKMPTLNTDQDQPIQENEYNENQLAKLSRIIKIWKQAGLPQESIFNNIYQEENDGIMDDELNFNEWEIQKEELAVELEIAKKGPKCIVSYTSQFRMRWDLIIIVLVLYNCVQIPFNLAFQDQYESIALEVFGYLVDSMFVLDIMINFRTSFIHHKIGIEITDGKLIAKEYLKQWRFWCDILSIIPFELLYNAFNKDSSNSNSTTFRVFDILKLVRLLRLGRIITYLKFKQDIKVGFRMVYLLVFLLLLVHWCGCIWYIIVTDSNWMPPKDVNYGSSDFYTSSMWQQYAVVFYYGILLLVGAEIDPTQTNQTVYASMVIILGQITTSFIFGNMAALMATINLKDQQFQDQFDLISNLMRAIQLPVNVQEEVESYLLHLQTLPDLQQDMRLFLKLLSPSLRSDILAHLFSRMLKNINIFNGCSDIETRYVVTQIKSVIFLPDDEIIRQGEIGDKLYFVTRGCVTVFIGSDEFEEDALLELKQKIHKKTNRSNDGEETSKFRKVTKIRKVREIKEDDYFGEIALVTKLKRTATVIAKDFTTLAFLTKKHFLITKQEFPQIFFNIKKAIKERYSDDNIKFRMKMLKNVPYFKNLSDNVIHELVYLLKPSKFDANMLIIKKGDSTDKIFFLKHGKIDVEIPLKNDKMNFDTLNPGSCFCLFSAFHEQRKQAFDFRTKTPCYIETISSADIISLQKEQLELADELRELRVLIEMNEKSEFDFFRYVPSQRNKEKEVDEKRSMIRKKLKMAVVKFFRRAKKVQPILNMLKANGTPESEIARRIIYDKLLSEPPDQDPDQEAIQAQQKRNQIISILEQDQQTQQNRLKYLKAKCSNPKLFQLNSAAPNSMKGFNPNLYEDPDSSEEDHQNQHLNQSAEIVNDYLTRRTNNVDDENNNLLQDFNQKITQRDYDQERYSVVNNLSDRNNSFDSSINDDILELEGVKKEEDMLAFKYSPSKNGHKNIEQGFGEFVKPPLFKIEEEEKITPFSIQPKKEQKTPIPELQIQLSSSFYDHVNKSNSQIQEQNNSNDKDLVNAINNLTSCLMLQSNNVHKLQLDVSKRMKFLEQKLNAAMVVEKRYNNGNKRKYLKKVLTVQERKFNFGEVQNEVLDYMRSSTVKNEGRSQFFRSLESNSQGFNIKPMMNLIDIQSSSQQPNEFPKDTSRFKMNDSDYSQEDEEPPVQVEIVDHDFQRRNEDSANFDLNSVDKWENKSTIYPSLEHKHKDFTQQSKTKKGSKNNKSRKVDTKKAQEIGKYTESTVGLLTTDKLDMDDIQLRFEEPYEEEKKLKEKNEKQKKTPPKGNNIETQETQTRANKAAQFGRKESQNEQQQQFLQQESQGPSQEPQQQKSMDDQQNQDGIEQMAQLKGLLNSNNINIIWMPNSTIYNSGQNFQQIQNFSGDILEQALRQQRSSQNQSQFSSASPTFRQKQQSPEETLNSQKQKRQ